MRAPSAVPEPPGFKAGSKRPGQVDARTLVLVVAGLAVAGATAFFVLRGGPANGGPAAWATLNTADVHALAFAPGDASHLYFGHHNGLLESRDGGRSWQPAALSGADAMNVSVAGGGRIQIAGHEVYLESSDGGASWQPVPNDLPGLDLHSFAMDPADSDHAWAFAVGFGLFESHDGGRHWVLRQGGNWGSLAAYRAAGVTGLVAIGPDGGVRSVDGGASWQTLAYPGAALAGGFAAAADGSALYAATTDGLQRSTDLGQTWRGTGFDAVAVAVAVAPDDPRVVALVDEATRFYRSLDGGASWPAP